MNHEPIPDSAQTFEHLLAEAIRVLTEAARIRRPVLQQDGTGGWEPHPSGTQPGDWAEFVVLALAGAAANLGGTEAALAGRPGSLESQLVRDLLTATVGPDDTYLWGHRREPLVITIPVDDILTDLDTAEPYYDAEDALDRHDTALNLPSDGELSAAQQAAVDDIADQRDALETHQRQAWTTYGHALRDAITTELARNPIVGRTVPVHVNLTAVEPGSATWTPPVQGNSLSNRLLDTAIQNTPLPFLEVDRVAPLARPRSNVPSSMTVSPTHPDLRAPHCRHPPGAGQPGPSIRGLTS